MVSSRVMNGELQDLGTAPRARPFPHVIPQTPLIACKEVQYLRSAISGNGIGDYGWRRV